MDSLTTALSQRLAISLFHFVWQGALIAALYCVVVQWLVRTARSRYAVGIGALAMMALCVPVTYALVNVPPPTTAVIEHNMRSAPPPLTAETESVAWGVGAPLAFDAPSVLGDRASPAAIAAVRDHAAAASATAQSDEDASYRDTLYQRIVFGWLVGVLLFGLRLVTGAVGLQLLAVRATRAEGEVRSVFDRLCRAIKLPKIPRLLVSTQVSEAIAAGFFRPLVVLPAAWLAELPPSVVEAVLAHELAHIRRHDLWVNLLQRTVEAVLFFHPAVWWLSREVRSERELCCDGLAVAATGEKVAYASALELVARRAAREPLFSLATGIGGRKMQLLERVRHVLGLPVRRQSGGWWAAGVLALAVPCGLWAITGPAAPVARAQEERKERERDADRDDERDEREDDDRDDVEDRDDAEDRDEERGERERRDGDRKRERDRGDKERGPEARRERDREAGAERRVSEEEVLQLRHAVEVAREELERQLVDTQAQLWQALREAEARGERERAEGLRREHEQIAHKIREQSRDMQRRLEVAIGNLRRGKVPTSYTEQRLSQDRRDRAVAAQKQVKAFEELLREGKTTPDFVIQARRLLAEALLDQYGASPQAIKEARQRDDRGRERDVQGAEGDRERARDEADEARRQAEKEAQQALDQLRRIQTSRTRALVEHKQRMKDMEEKAAEGVRQAVEQGDRERAEAIRQKVERMRQNARKEAENLQQRFQAQLQEAEARSQEANEADIQARLHVLSEASKGGRRDAGPRDEGRHNDADREMMQMIKELRNEVQELRREVKELRQQRPKKDVSQDTKQPEIGVPVLKEIPYVGKLFGGEKPEKPANVKPKVSIEFDGKKLEGSDLELTAPKGKISIGVSKDGSGGLVGEIHLDADVKRAEQAAAAADTVETEVQKAKQQVKKLELEFKNQAGQAAEKAQKVEDVIREKLKDIELKFEQPKLEKLQDIKLKLKDAPIEKLEDIESKLKNAELELKKSAVKDEIDKANEELKQSLKKLDGENVKAVDKQAIDETKLRYAEKAAQVSEAELDQALQANKRKPSSVSEAKLDEMKLRHKQALIEVDRAKHQLDEQLSRLKKQLENDAAGKKADTEAKPEKP